MAFMTDLLPLSKLAIYGATSNTYYIVFVAAYVKSSDAYMFFLALEEIQGIHSVSYF